MGRKRKQIQDDEFKYSKTKSFENLEAVQQMALNRKGKDDEVNPDISVFLKAEELKCKLCGLYNDKDSQTKNINVMGCVKINGKELKLKMGTEINTDTDDDRIT